MLKHNINQKFKGNKFTVLVQFKQQPRVMNWRDETVSAQSLTRKGLETQPSLWQPELFSVFVCGVLRDAG